MSITVGKLFGNGAILYKMRLLAGQKGLDNLVEWVHIIENDEVSEFLHGNEVVLTSGILNKRDGWLLEYTKKLYAAGTSAFIVNIGPYTKFIQKEVLDYCNEIQMPLYTIPWETRMVDLTRDICYRIMQSEQVEISIASTIKNIIFKTGDLETLTLQLERYGYLRYSSFCFIVMCFENKEKNELDMTKVKIFSEKIARSINELYISFSYKNYWILVLVNYSDYNTKKFIDTFYKKWNKNFGRVYMGISENKHGIKFQAENFNNSLTAINIARKKNKEVIFYNELEIHKILLNVKDKEILERYYKDTLGKLEKYDEENKTNLVEFLDIYLKNNGSQSLIAEKQYIHRNTVNNQLKKIEKIIGSNIYSLEEKLKLYLAYFIKDVL